MMEFSSMKNIELDKICRVCLGLKKDMRPLFGEMISDMLQDCARVHLENLDGWPDKICVQCIHQVSRFHAFKLRVEKNDSTLRDYIKGLTVITEETTLPKEISIQQIDLNKHLTTTGGNALQQIQEIQIQRSSDMQTQTNHQHHHGHSNNNDQNSHPQQMIVTNAQILNNNGTAQLLNTGQIVTTANGQHQMIQGQLLQAGNTVQIMQNGQPTQLLQIQRTSDDHCEIIVQQSDIGEAQYYEELVVSTQNHIQQQHQQIEHEELVEIEDDEDEEQYILTTNESPPVSASNTTMNTTCTSSDVETDSEEKQYLAEFMTFQTSCVSPGRHVCNLCHKEFKHTKWLQSHMKSHSNWIKANCKKQPQCEICLRSFRGPGMLKMHMKTHERSDKKPTCSICNTEFQSKSILYKHRQTHFEQKSHQCNICNKNYASNYQLKAHMARHRGEKSFKCQHCDKGFYSATDLKNHVRQHLGIKLSQAKKNNNNSSTTTAS